MTSRSSGHVVIVWRLPVKPSDVTEAQDSPWNVGRIALNGRGLSVDKLVDVMAVSMRREIRRCGEFL